LRTSRRALLRFGVAAAVLTVAGCSDGTASTQGVTAPAPALSAGQAGFFGGTDLAWIEINIAMDEQLLPLLALAPAKGSDPAVRAYAAAVESFTNAELATLRMLHDQARLPAENPHEGMPMPGMVTPEQVTAAQATGGASFDKTVVELIEAHLTQGTSLATSETKAGVEPQTLALAATVLSTRAKALKDAKDLSQ
jgi:uncharacterized protein (DUF305 family)